MKDDRREQIPVDRLPMIEARQYYVLFANRFRVDFVRAGIFLKKSGCLSLTTGQGFDQEARRGLADSTGPSFRLS